MSPPQASSPPGVSSSSRRSISAPSCGARAASAGPDSMSHFRTQASPGLFAAESCCATLNASAPVAASSRAASACSAVRSAAGMLA